MKELPGTNEEVLHGHRILQNSFKSANFLEGVSFEWLVPSFEWSHPQTRKWQIDRKSSLLSLGLNGLSCFYSWGTTLRILCFVTSWTVVVTSVQRTAFSRKKDVVWKFQRVFLFFVKPLFNLGLVLVSIIIVIKTFLFKLLILSFHQ